MINTPPKQYLLMYTIVWCDHSGHISALVFLDLSSALTLSIVQSYLNGLEKRFVLGGIAFKWYRSYLSDRMQIFQVGSQNSRTFVIYCSVPQGSVLEVLKFLVYTEDRPAVIERYAIELHLYADNTQLSDDPPITSFTASISNMEHCIDAVHTWCLSKHLQLNPMKSEIIWFGIMPV